MTYQLKEISQKIYVMKYNDILLLMSSHYLLTLLLSVKPGPV